MNKKLLAIAIAGVIGAPLAQAQTANVTLYGRLNLDTEVIINQKQDTSTPGRDIKQNIYRVASNSSRLGVRGTESLGGGLNMIFQLELGSLPATSNGPVNVGRETFAGLQGGWGTAKIGYFLTPYDDVQSIFGSAPTLQTGILGSQSLWSNTGYVGNSVDTGAFDDRVGHSIRYDSPTVSGFNGSVQIGGREVGGTDGGDLTQQRRHAYIVSTGGFYNNGPLSAGVVYERHNKLRTGTATNPGLRDDGITLAGSWNFGVVKVGAAYERLKYDIASGGDLKRNFWAISATANVGPGQLYAAYYAAGNGTGSAKCVTTGGTTVCPRVGALTLGSESKAQQWEVSYTYPLSKRTLLYTGYTFIDNHKNAGYNFGVNQISGVCTGNGAACGVADKPQGLVTGIVVFW